jgi:hypothetical protein
MRRRPLKAFRKIREFVDELRKRKTSPPRQVVRKDDLEQISPELNALVEKFNRERKASDRG